MTVEKRRRKRRRSCCSKSNCVFFTESVLAFPVEGLGEAGGEAIVILAQAQAQAELGIGFGPEAEAGVHTGLEIQGFFEEIAQGRGALSLAAGERGGAGILGKERAILVQVAEHQGQALFKTGQISTGPGF
jgi:hypothetical protein